MAAEPQPALLLCGTRVWELLVNITYTPPNHATRRMSARKKRIKATQWSQLFKGDFKEKSLIVKQVSYILKIISIS